MKKPVNPWVDPEDVAQLRLELAEARATIEKLQDECYNLRVALQEG